MIVFYNNGVPVVEVESLRQKSPSGIVDCVVEDLGLAFRKAVKVDHARDYHYIARGNLHIHATASLTLESRVAAENGLDVAVYQTYTFPDLQVGGETFVLAVYRTQELTATGVRVRDLQVSLKLDSIVLDRGEVQRLMQRYKCGRVRIKKVVLVNLEEGDETDRVNINFEKAEFLMDSDFAFHDPALSTEDKAVLVPTRGFRERHSDYWERLKKC